MNSFANFDDSGDPESNALTRSPASRAVVRGTLAAPSRPTADGFDSDGFDDFDSHNLGAGTQDQRPPYGRSEPLGRAPGAGRAFGAAPFGTVGPPDRASLQLKNPLFAGAVGLVFGPLGLAYANPTWAVGLGALTVGAVFSGMWILLPGIWFASGFIGFGSAIHHNTREILGPPRRPASLT